jgi:hypothetical protein
MPSSITAITQHSTYPREVKQLRPGVLHDGPVVVLLKELTPVVYNRPPPVVRVQQLPHADGGVQLQALLAFLQAQQSRGTSARGLPERAHIAYTLRC